MEFQLLLQTKQMVAMHDTQDFQGQLKTSSLTAETDNGTMQAHINRRDGCKTGLSASLYISTNNKVITLWPLYTYKNCYSNNRMHHLA